MPRLIDNPEHWRARAEETRAIAEKLLDPEARRMMREIADRYEKLAERAERRRAGEPEK
jgi:hypothetical protein